MVDWIVCPVSDANVANHRDWFETYTPFRTTAIAGNGATMEVLGIGDVVLEVRANGDKYCSGRLSNVLYAPSSITNIFAVKRMNGGRVNGGENGKICYNDGRELLLDRPRLQRLWLVGQKEGQTSLKKE